MSQSLVRSIFVGIANTINWLFWTTFLVALYLGITDPDILFGNFYSDRPNTFPERLAAQWQKMLLICIFIFLMVIAWGSAKVQNSIRKINTGGNMLIPILVLAHITIVVGFVFVNKITYPSTGADEKVISVYFLAAATLVYVPFLISLNQELKKPASFPIFVTFCVALYVPSYFGLLVWAHYIFSGEINPMLVLQRFFIS